MQQTGHTTDSELKAQTLQIPEMENRVCISHNTHFQRNTLKVMSVYDHLNTQKFHTFAYERKAFALQCYFSELYATNSAQIPIFTMGQMRVEIFRLSNFEEIILQRFEKLKNYKDLYEDH